MTTTQKLYALAQDHTTLSLALRNAIENHAWAEVAVVGGKLLGTESAIAGCLKDMDGQLFEAMQRAHAEEMESITGKYKVTRTPAQLVAAAEDAVQAAAKVCTHIDAAKIIVALRGEGQAAKGKKA